MKKIFTLIFSLAVAATAMADDGTKLFTSNSSDVSTTNPTHRIPAIVTLGDNIIAFSDERYGTNGGDVGSGRIDIVCRISTDNGKTWGEQQTVAQGTGNNSNTAAYGDAAVVMDRDSGKILVMAAAGATSYGSSKVSSGWGGSNYSNALRVAKIVGTPTVDDDGKITGISWATPSDVTSTVYGACSSQSIAKAFFGSGRICQSTLIKNGDDASYRIYAALTTDKGSVVVYSDDFGSTWTSLGVGASGGDEAKVEELPNGDVLLCAKNSSNTGRIFNIYHWTNIVGGSGAAGSWGTAASTSDLDAAKCNGEIFFVRATNTTQSSTNYNKDAYVALMSVPASSSRENVTIYWKGIDSENDCNNISAFTTASKWKSYQVSTTNSAYSTMRQDGNGNIAFLYEENNYPHSNTEAYDIVFKTIPLETITDSAYSSDDPWEGRIVTLKAQITNNNTTTSYYLHDAANGTGGDVKIELVEDTEAPDSFDYSYYWVISKSPILGLNSNRYYYLSSYKGDGYIGKVDGTNYSTGATQRTAVGCTTDYTWEFKFRDFVKKSVLENGKGSSAENMSGYALNYIDTWDSNKNKYVSVNDNGALNWHDHTIKGENTLSDGHYWSTDFEIADVTRINPNDTVPSCGTKAAPTEYGFPVTFTRHDNTYALKSFEDYHYYATLKLPFAVSLPKDVKAYQVATMPGASTDGDWKQVGLTELTLKQSKRKDNEGNAAYILPRETPVLLMMTNSAAGDDGKTAGGDVKKTVYLTPETAQKIQETGFGGTLGARTFTTDEYDYSNNPNLFLLSKKNGRVAFRYLTGQKVNANKAYYKYDGTASAKELSFVFVDDDTTTAIDRYISVDSDDNADTDFYDLAGRKVAKPSRKGVYVSKGKKMIVR